MALKHFTEAVFFENHISGYPGFGIVILPVLSRLTVQALSVQHCRGPSSIFPSGGRAEYDLIGGNVYYDNATSDE